MAARMLKRALSCLIGCGMLAGCGGGGGAAGVPNSYTNPAGFYATNQPLQNAMVDTVTALPGTAFKNFPTTGSVTYNGYSKVVVSTPTTPVELLGLASLNADFGNRAVSGTLSNFAGNYQDTSTNPITVNSPQVSYAGTIAVTNGVHRHHERLRGGQAEPVRRRFCRNADRAGQYARSDGRVERPVQGNPDQGCLCHRDIGRAAVQWHTDDRLSEYRWHALTRWPT